jgi:hypothetical protein
VLSQWFPSTPDNRTHRPLSIRVLTWAFVDSRIAAFFRDTAARLFGARRST